jgi:hypothetical protein
MIRDLFSDIFSWDTPLVDRIIALLLSGAMTALIALCGILFLSQIDKAILNFEKTTIVHVDDKRISPAKTTRGLIPIGKVPVPTHHRRRESYLLSIKLNGVVHECYVKKDVFDNTSAGDRMLVEYGLGWLSGSVHIKSITKI